MTAGGRGAGAVLAGLLAVGCGSGADRAIIAIDGSSTVFPITEAVAEEFQAKHPARVTIGVSGTGGGFKKFCQGEVAIAGASRPIKPSEIDLCRSQGIGWIELPVAYDGIAIVVHPENTWVDAMSVEELRALWRPEAQGQVTRWSQIRAGWPDQEIRLFGPGVDSGTYDYFTQAIVGKEHSSRGDYTSSEDDNVLVQGIWRDPLALGFFGFAYYVENRERVKLVPIRASEATTPVAPSFDTVADGTYQPLSRPVFLYVSSAAATREEVLEFVRFYLGPGRRLVREVGYIPLPDRAYELALSRFESRTEGSVFGGKGSRVGARVEDLLGGGGR